VRERRTHGSVRGLRRESLVYSTVGEIANLAVMNGLRPPLTDPVWQIGSQGGSLKLRRSPQSEETNEQFQQWQKSCWSRWEDR